jgi:S1-C subfamily serine protease
VLLATSPLLAHLDLVVAASPERTAADFRGPSTFRRTEAAARLALTNLPELEPVDQRMIGVAVGQRAASGTFVVFEEGVDAAIDSGDLVIWPPAYRAGVAEGLFLDRNGYLVLNARVVGSALDILRALPDRGVEELRGLLQRVRKTDLAPSTTADDAASVSLKLREAARGEDEQVLRSLLKQLAGTVEDGTETAPSM